MSRKNRRKKARNTAAVPEGTAATYFVLFTRNWSDAGFAFTVLVTVLWPWSLYKNWKKGPKKR